ncbi:MAG: hypothetical protein OEZ02_11205 [Anaerolineae bacterium]|nr:hypothetical protein [Anaerolineae bacterium]
MGKRKIKPGCGDIIFGFVFLVGVGAILLSFPHEINLYCSRIDIDSNGCAVSKNHFFYQRILEFKDSDVKSIDIEDGYQGRKLVLRTTKGTYTIFHSYSYFELKRIRTQVYNYFFVFTDTEELKVEFVRNKGMVLTIGGGLLLAWGMIWAPIRFSRWYPYSYPFSRIVKGLNRGYVRRKNKLKRKFKKAIGYEEQDHSSKKANSRPWAEIFHSASTALVLIGIAIVFSLFPYKTRLQCSRVDPSVQMCTVTKYHLLWQKKHRFHFFDYYMVKINENRRGPESVMLETNIGDFEIYRSNSREQLDKVWEQVYDFFHDKHVMELEVDHMGAFGVVSAGAALLCAVLALLFLFTAFEQWYPDNHPYSEFFRKAGRKWINTPERELEIIKRNADFRIWTGLSPEQCKRKLEASVEEMYKETKRGKPKKNFSDGVIGEAYSWAHDGYRFKIQRGRKFGRIILGSITGDCVPERNGTMIWVKFTADSASNMLLWMILMPVMMIITSDFQIALLVKYVFYGLLFLVSVLAAAWIVKKWAEQLEKPYLEAFVEDLFGRREYDPSQ